MLVRTRLSAVQAITYGQEPLLSRDVALGSDIDPAYLPCVSQADIGVPVGLQRRDSSAGHNARAKSEWKLEDADGVLQSLRSVTEDRQRAKAQRL